MNFYEDKILTSLGLSKGLFHDLEPEITKEDILADLKADLAFLELEKSAELFRRIKELDSMDDESFWELYNAVPPLEVIGDSIVPISKKKQNNNP
ncbi:TPA: hypothetical protein KET05_002975 [Enterococcus faecalis]|nr:hypothetical protein [Enterococcus faecalis]